MLLLVLARESQQLVRGQAASAGGDREESDSAETPTHPETSEAGIEDDSTETPVVEREPIDQQAVEPTAPGPAGEPAATPPETTRVSESAHGSSPPEVALTPAVMLANVAFTQAFITSVLVVAAWYFSIPATALGIVAEPLSTGLPGVAVGVVFGLALWVANEAATAVADVVGAAYDETVRELLAPESSRGWLFLFVAVLPLIAFSEELLFRAALIGVPAAGYGISVWLLAVGSSLAFALGHGAQGRVGVVVTGLLGFGLAAGYILTDSLLVVVVAHYVINAMEFLVHELLGIETPG